jgi:hypothetical protein
LPVHLAIDARVNLNYATVPVIASVLWVVASYLVSDSESFERVRARDACEQFHQFLLVGSRKFGERIAKV